MANDQQAIPIYDLIAQALHKWDISGLTKFDDLAYENTVVWLLQHLEPLSDCNDVERLLLQALAEQQGSPQFTPEQSLLIKALADDLWNAWSQYLHRRDQSAFAQARSRGRGLMGRHYYPRTHSR